MLWPLIRADILTRSRPSTDILGIEGDEFLHTSKGKIRILISIHLSLSLRRLAGRYAQRRLTTEVNTVKIGWKCTRYSQRHWIHISLALRAGISSVASVSDRGANNSVQSFILNSSCSVESFRSSKRVASSSSLVVARLHVYIAHDEVQMNPEVEMKQARLTSFDASITTGSQPLKADPSTAQHCMTDQNTPSAASPASGTDCPASRQFATPVAKGTL